MSNGPTCWGGHINTLLEAVRCELVVIVRQPEYYVKTGQFRLYRNCCRAVTVRVDKHDSVTFHTARGAKQVLQQVSSDTVPARNAAISNVIHQAKWNGRPLPVVFSPNHYMNKYRNNCFAVMKRRDQCNR